MRIADETICKACRDVFCCVFCRVKHEKKSHGIVASKSAINTKSIKKSNDEEYQNGAKADYDFKYIFCPICERRPLILKGDIHNEIILHIGAHHLPLQCQKCFKIYSKIYDLKEFSKCNRECLTYNKICNTDKFLKTNATATDTEMPHCMVLQSPSSKRKEFNESNMTPISIINMRWKAKKKLTNEEFITDSVSSIKNISSINNSSVKRGTEVSSKCKDAMIRCSSTPVQLEMMLAKPTEQTFNVIGGHMSSIRYNSGCDSDISPFPRPYSQALEPVNRYIKVVGSRPKISAVTPLRQVMSKSIQKAFAEHGFPLSNSVRSSDNFQRKRVHERNKSPENNYEQSYSYSALDLRMSPAIRRSQNEIGKSLKGAISNNEPRDYIYLSAQKLTTESIVIRHMEHLASISSSTKSKYSMNSIKNYQKSTKPSYRSFGSSGACSSVFQSCRSVEIITATREEIQQVQSYERGNAISNLVPPLTPRIPASVIHKKIIKFETPKFEACDSSEVQNFPNDLFFTPNASPIHNNGSASTESKRKLSGKPNLTDFSSVGSTRAHLHKFDDDKDKNSRAYLAEKLGDENEIKTQQSNGLWSLMTSVMRLPSLKKMHSKETYGNGQKYTSTDSNSKSIMKRCASIAGSLARSKSSVVENENISLKRKRTFTMDDHMNVSYLTESKNPETALLTSHHNTSKRFRIQGRRPINRMRLNS